MKNAMLKICGIALFVALVGCDAIFQKEPEKTIRAIIATTNDVADSLHEVHDADSARAAIDTVDRKFTLLTAYMSKVPALEREYKGFSTDANTAAELSKAMPEAFARVHTELERLNNLPGLPVEFWKMLEARALEFAMTGYEAIPADKAASAAGLVQYLRNLQELQQKFSYEEVVKVDFTNMRFDLAQKARDKLQNLAPAATLYHVEAGDVMSVVLAPVKDFKALAAAIDFGDVVIRNESKRSLTVKVQPMKLGAKANTISEEIQQDIKESQERSQKERREMEERMARSRAESDRREAARIKEEGDPSDPDYYDKLAENLTSTSYFKKKKAIEVLLSTSPSQISSADTRKKIARGFKDLAESARFSEKEEAIKGLVIWGGKYSGPILLKMLEDAGTFEGEPIMKALGDLKYAKAAPALAARLGDFHDHHAARKALRAMGEEAEDALIVVAPSQNPDVCIAAVELLGDCGTTKSLPVLRRGASSRNMRVRDASKEAIRKIMARQKGTKADEA